MKFLQDVDRLLRSATKPILELPSDTPDSMLYSDPKFKGLGLFRATWEARLQHINICRTLYLAHNPYISSTRDLIQESVQSVGVLNIEVTSTLLDARTNMISGRKVRQQLRLLEFNRWKELPTKGKGVELYAEYTPTNNWVRNHQGLSTSEWREALKMTGNVSAVRAVPGRSQDNNLCRRCHRETETLAHVLGSCPYGELLRNARHHRIRSAIADALREKCFEVYEEVHGVAVTGSHRRIDMLAFQPGSSVGFILDPTVRFEQHKGQPEDVDREKREIYAPTIPYYLEKFHLEKIVIYGLLIGARGTISRHVVTVWNHFHLDREKLKTLSLLAIKGSVSIFRNHCYT